MSTMANGAAPAGGSKWKLLLAWGAIAGLTVFWVVFWFSLQGRPPSESELPGDATPRWFRTLVLVGLGGFGMVAGAIAYLVVVQTQCFTFNFQRPVWSNLKPKLYVANILVPVMFMIGAGLMLSAVATPTLEGMGLSKDAAWLAPIIAPLVILQLALVWVNVWAPMEKRLISKRLAAQGVTPEQVACGYFVGLSDPARSSFKKLTQVEEDVGMLWLDTERLVYFGDREQLSFAREQVLSLERKVDAGGTTSLSGAAHPILRVRQPDGTERQIRLHVEGLWTLGQKRAAMNALAQRLGDWLASARGSVAAGAS